MHKIKLGIIDIYCIPEEPTSIQKILAVILFLMFLFVWFVDPTIPKWLLTFGILSSMLLFLADSKRC
jgi:hypothetical protein